MGEGRREWGRELHHPNYVFLCIFWGWFGTFRDLSEWVGMVFDGLSGSGVGDGQHSPRQSENLRNLFETAFPPEALQVPSKSCNVLQNPRKSV